MSNTLIASSVMLRMYIISKIQHNLQHNPKGRRYTPMGSRTSAESGSAASFLLFFHCPPSFRPVPVFFASFAL